MFLSETPLWLNPLYAELSKLEGFWIWEMADGRYLSQLFTQNILKSFSNHQNKYALWRQFYKYLNHALQVQAHWSTLVLFDHPLIWAVFPVPHKKGTVSQIYFTQSSTIQNSSILLCRRGWEGDLGSIDEEVSEMCLQSVPLVSMPPTHKLSQLFV